MTLWTSTHLDRIVIRSPGHFKLRIQTFVSVCRNRRKEALGRQTFGGCASIELRMWSDRSHTNEERSIRSHRLVEKSDCIVPDHICRVNAGIVLWRILVSLRRGIEVDVCVWIE